MIEFPSCDMEKIDKLVPYAKNPKEHSDKDIDLIIKSIQRNGWGDPILVCPETNEILSGHGRWLAAKKMKLDAVPIVYAPRGLTEKQKADLVIASNKLVEVSGYNDNLTALVAEFDLSFDDFGMDVTIESEPKEIVEDEVPETVETRCKRGDIWQLGNHRLMCGDSTSIDDVDKLMNGEKADLLFTDPPYGVSYEKKTKEVLNSKSYTKIQNDDLSLEQFKDFLHDVFANAFVSLKDTASYYVFSCQGGDQEMMMMMMRESGIPCRHQIIWVKDAPVFSMGRLDYDYKHEPILYGWVKKHEFKRKGSQDKSVWEFARTANKLHPTMKPIELIENALLNSTDKQDLVLDLFGGSGSTLIACEQLDRKCFMMELDEHYCDVIIQRWENLTGQKAEKINASE